MHSFLKTILTAAAGVLISTSAHAGVYLSWTTCNNLSVPVISTDESSVLSGPYRLRAKFIDGSPNGYHAATAEQNNNYSLDSLPGPGTYTVALYWVKYTDYSYSTVQSVGTETQVSVTVENTFSYQMTTTSIDARAFDPRGGIYYFEVQSPTIITGSYYNSTQWAAYASHSSSGTASLVELFAASSLSTHYAGFSYSTPNTTVYLP